MVPLRNLVKYFSLSFPWDNAYFLISGDPSHLNLFSKKSPEFTLWSILHCIVVSHIYVARCNCVPEISTLSNPTRALVTSIAQARIIADIRLTITSMWDATSCSFKAAARVSFTNIWITDRSDFFATVDESTYLTRPTTTLTTTLS